MKPAGFPMPNFLKYLQNLVPYPKLNNKQYNFQCTAKVLALAVTAPFIFFFTVLFVGRATEIASFELISAYSLLI